MKKTYYILKDNLEKVSDLVVKINGKWVSNPTEEQYAEISAYTCKPDNPPKCEEGYHAVRDKWVLSKDKQWEQTWKIVKDEGPTYTVEDYDQVLEQHIKEACIARGYTTREPSDYLYSSIVRWSQDAKDYIAFRDQVMQYGLEIMNKFQNNEEVPTLEEFKDNLPQIVWTYE